MGFRGVASQPHGVRLPLRYSCARLLYRVLANTRLTKAKSQTKRTQSYFSTQIKEHSRQKRNICWVLIEIGFEVFYGVAVEIQRRNTEPLTPMFEKGAVVADFRFQETELVLTDNDKHPV